MWGSWFSVTLAGLGVVLLVIAIGFGTSALLIPVILAAAILVVLALARAFGGTHRQVDPGRLGRDRLRDGGAPVEGEGSAAADRPSHGPPHP